MIHKNFLIFTNVLATVFKIILGLYIFALLVITAIIFSSTIPDKLQILMRTIINFLPFIVLLYVFIAAFYFGMAYYEKIEFFGKDSEFDCKPTLFFDLRNNSFIEGPFSQENHFPITKTLLIIPDSKKGKKISTATSLPFQVLNNSNIFHRFFNIMRFTIPDSLESNDIISIPYGGLFDKDMSASGDLYLQIKFLTRKQSILFSLVQISTVLIPLILFFTLLFH